MKTLFAAAAVAAVSLTATAATETLSVSVIGPGGHSNGSYGQTNALHAPARGILNIEKAVPTAVISGFNGGATVNAIEADARFDVVLTGNKAALAEQKKLVHKAVADGGAAENAFRNVKAGDKTRSGAPADIRFTAK